MSTNSMSRLMRTRPYGIWPRDLPFGDEIISVTDEFNVAETIEARIARDADQLDLMMELKEQKDLGNRYAIDWLFYAEKRLLTESGKKMADEIAEDGQH